MYHCIDLTVKFYALLVTTQFRFFLDCTIFSSILCRITLLNSLLIIVEAFQEVLSDILVTNRKLHMSTRFLWNLPQKLWWIFPWPFASRYSFHFVDAHISFAYKNSGRMVLLESLTCMVLSSFALRTCFIEVSVFSPTFITSRFQHPYLGVYSFCE